MDDRAGEGTSKAGAARKPIRVQTLIALVACCVALPWAFIAAREGMRPSLRWARMLRSGDVDDRQIAARQLGDGPVEDLDVAVPALVTAMGDEDEPVRSAAATALGIAGLTALKAKDVRGDAKEAAGVLTHALADPGPEVRMASAVALADLAASSKDLGFPAEPDAVVSAMVEMLADPSISVRKRGESALVKLISETKTGSPPPSLVEGLKAWPLKESRAAAAVVLGTFKGGVEATVEALIAALKDKEPEVRSNAAVALRRLELAAAPALLALVANLDDSFVPPPPPPPRYPGLVAMASPGGGAGSGIDEPTDPSVQAAKAIGKIVQAQVEKGGTPPAEVVPALTKALHADRPALKEAAEEAIRQVGKGASAAIPDLIEHLAGSVPKAGPGYGSGAAAALGDLAPGTDRAPQAIEVLTLALGAKETDTRRAAARALMAFGPAASAALPRLRELGQDPEQGVARVASEAADRIEGKPAPEKAARKGQGRRGRGGAPRP